MRSAVAPDIDPIRRITGQLAQAFALRAQHHDRDQAFPYENFEALHAAGLMGLTVPAATGGLGGGLRELLYVVGELGRGEPSTALVLALHCSVVASITRAQSWPQHLREHVLRDVVRNGALINALRVEPALGTPARGGLPGAVARRDGKAWRISGRKIYSTGAPLLKWALVWAATEEPDVRVGHFLVPMSTGGITIEPTWEHLGMRASGSHDVVFDAAAIPEDHAVDIRRPGDWEAVSAVEIAWFATVVTAVYDGVARAARDWLAGWLQTRTPTNLGASLATLPRFQEAMGEIDLLLAVNRRLLEDIGRQADLQPDSLCATDGGIVKTTVTRNGIRAVELALSLTGNAGLSRHNALERHYRDVLCSRVHTPQDDSTLVALGRAALNVNQIGAAA